jgi:hypothetical protein
MIFFIPVRVCPSSPLTPFSHTGRRGILGVLMPETGDVAQELPKKPYPCKIPLSPSPTRGEEGVWAS